MQGRLDGHWAAWFGDLTLTHHPDGTTTLRGPVADQAELHGLLARIRDLGVTLISLQEVAPTRDPGFVGVNPAGRLEGVLDNP